MTTRSPPSSSIHSFARRNVFGRYFCWGIYKIRWQNGQFRGFLITSEDVCGERPICGGKVWSYYIVYINYFQLSKWFRTQKHNFKPFWIKKEFIGPLSTWIMHWIYRTILVTWARAIHDWIVWFLTTDNSLDFASFELNTPQSICINNREYCW